MNKEYKIKLDLNKKLYNKKMAFNQFDKNVNDFYIEITKNNEVVKDLDKSIITLVAIKPNSEVDAQFIEVKEGQIYADLKPSMCDLVGNYQAKAMIVLEGKIVTTDTINYSVNEDKIISRLNEDVVSDERFTLFTDALARLSTIEISEEQRVINEAERILSEENRKIEEAKRVEAELIRVHEEADRTKYDATRESNENIRKQNESIRLANETNRIDEESKRVEEENKRKLAEEERNANYNFMTEDEERRRSEANAHKEAEVLRVQAETNRVNEEAKRRTTEQARVSAENTRVSNENTREANEVARQSNETQRVEAEIQRQNRYNSFITDAEANADNFENYTNTAKVKEEERKSNELDRKLQEDRRVSNEVERISNENTRKANEKAREKNETSRQNIFENKVNEVNEKIIEINTTKDNFVSSINTKVDTKISELDNAKSDMTNTVSNKVNEVETRFNALTSKQQQDAEVIDARDGEASLKARLDRDIEKANKELDRVKKLEESTVSTVETESDFTTVEQTSNGYFEDVKLEGKTLVNLVNYSNKSLEGSRWNNFVKIDCLNSMLKQSTEYTIIAYVEGLSANKGFSINCNVNYGLFKPSTFDIEQNGMFVFKWITKSDFTDMTDVLFTAHNPANNIGTFTLSLCVLEGDHTQNPPAYFEGLKSVGQSATTSEDGADEIVVSSVNENLFDSSLYKGILTTGTGEEGVGTRYAISDYFICPYDSIYFSGDYAKQRVILHYDKNKNYLGFTLVNDDSYYNQPTNSYYARIRLDINGTEIFDIDSNFKVNVSKNNIKYQPHQSDKKRLLYYNNETQSWEKPVLREWDSIEKHADGKYYYHQRSGEVVLNGSENWEKLTPTYIEDNNSYFCSKFLDKLSLIQSQCMSDKFKTVEVWANNEEGLCVYNTNEYKLRINISKTKLSTQDVQGFKQWLQANNVTVVYQLAKEKVYECTNIDLITYANETNYIVESGAIAPKSTLKVHNNISNVVSLLQKKVSLLESNVTSYMITQNRLMLASRYNADTVSFKVDVASYNNSFEYDNDLYELILNNILVGKDNYNRDYIENLIIFYWMDFVISDEMYLTLFEIIEEQHNPKVIEEEAPIEE